MRTAVALKRSRAVSRTVARVVVLAVALGAGCKGKPSQPPSATQSESAGPPASGEVTSPVLVRASGDVTVGAPGALEAARPGTALAGRQIVTGPDGVAIVRLPDGREVEVRGGSRLTLGAGKGTEVTLEVQAGSVVTRVQADRAPVRAGTPEVSLAILTPFGVTRVPRTPHEATIAVRGDGAGLDVDVAVGEIVFVDKAGVSRKATRAERIEVSLEGVVIVRGPRPQPSPTVATEAGQAAVTERPTRRIVSSQGLEIVLSADEGALLVRRPGEKAFARRRAVPALPGTAFRATGRARIVAEGLVARLSSGARGRIGEVARGDDGDRIALALEAGSATVTTAPGRQRALELSAAGRPFTVRTSGATTLAIQAGRRDTTVEVLAGEAELERDGMTEHLGAATQARVEAKRVALGSRRSADVILPTARGLHVAADGLTHVTLSWDEQLADARVEVAADPAFTEVLLAGPVTGRQVTVPAPRRGQLFWRVTGKTTPAAGGAPEKTIVGQARFAPDRKRSVLDLASPHNTVAENAEATKVYFQGALPALTFTFAGKGASRYRVRVFKEGDLAKPLVDREVSEARCPIEAGIVTEGRYVWSATPLDKAGRDAGGGRMNKLELVYDNSLTTLAIGSPRAGQVVTSREVDVMGVAPIGARLFVNGQAAPLDAKGRFEMRLPAASALVFRLVGRNGAESYFVRRLRLKS